MAPVLIPRSHDVEHEKLNAIVQSLMVEEKLRQKAEILTVSLVGASVDLEEAQVSVSVDLIARRVLQRALFCMAVQLRPGPEVVEAELAHVQRPFLGKLLRVRAEVPGRDLVATHLNHVKVFHSVLGRGGVLPIALTTPRLRGCPVTILRGVWVGSIVKPPALAVPQIAVSPGVYPSPIGTVRLVERTLTATAILDPFPVHRSLAYPLIKPAVGVGIMNVIVTLLWILLVRAN